MPAAPFRLTGPESIVSAIPYLLGFTPTDSLVLVGLTGTQLQVTARVDLDTFDTTGSVADLMHTLVIRAGCTHVVAVTYGQRTETATIAETAAAAGLELAEHLRVDEGRYWSLTCPIEGCCPAEGRPLSTDHAVAAEFVGIGASTVASRDQLAACLDPQPGGERLDEAIRERREHDLAMTHDGFDDARIVADQRAILAAAQRTDRVWSDAETARFAVALAGYPVRDAVWMAVDEGTVDGRELFAHLARTLPASHRAPALFLFAWKTWREGNGALASMALDRVFEADPDYTAAQLLQTALERGVDPRRMPKLQLSG